MTTTEIARILARIDALDRESASRHEALRGRLDRIEADLGGVLDREQRQQMRADVRAQVLAEYGLDDVTDHGPLVPVEPRKLAQQDRDTLERLVDTVRENFRFTLVAVLIGIAIIAGGVPQVVVALQTLGYLPAAPVETRLDADKSSGATFRPDPFSPAELP